MNFQEKYNYYQQYFEKYLDDTLNGLSGHDKLISAMRYSLKAGGKRVRPVLLLATCDLLGGDLKVALPYALSVECIHTYSLIHDDLPCMDNDDMRRGKPTSHKVFGEDFAVLSGDALLTFAFEHALESTVDKKGIDAVCYLAKCSGFSGMVGGQAHDINPLSDGESQLFVTEINKTSKLICASLKMAGILFGGNCSALESFGEKLGLIYQFVDDLLDATGSAENLGKAVGKDIEMGKISAVAVYGIERTKEEILKLERLALEELKNAPNSEFLADYLKISTKRIK